MTLHNWAEVLFWKVFLSGTRHLETVKPSAACVFLFDELNINIDLLTQSESNTARGVFCFPCRDRTFGVGSQLGG